MESFPEGYIRTTNEEPPPAYFLVQREKVEREREWKTRICEHSSASQIKQFSFPIPSLNLMAVSSFARAFPSFECRSDPDFSLPEIPSAGYGGYSARSKSAVLRGAAGSHGLSSLILKFPPNFVRQLSVKSRRNCSNIGVAQIVAASWSNNQGASVPAPAAKAVDAAAAAAAAPVEVETGVENGVLPAKDPNVQTEDLPKYKYASFLNSDGSVAIHAGMLLMSRLYLIYHLLIPFCMNL